MHTLPVPVPGASEVLIAVHTAEVGGWDADVRGGCFLKPAIGKRGYHEDEVDEFLDGAAATIASLDDRA